MGRADARGAARRAQATRAGTGVAGLSLPVPARPDLFGAVVRCQATTVDFATLTLAVSGAAARRVE